MRWRVVITDRAEYEKARQIYGPDYFKLEWIDGVNREYGTHWVRCYYYHEDAMAKRAELREQGIKTELERIKR